MVERTPLFDPQDPGHKTAEEWAVAGNQPWFTNAFLHAVRFGESRILLQAGNVLRLTFYGQGPLVVEEL